MKNASLILYFSVVLFFTKLKANTFEPTQGLNQLNSLPKSSVENEMNPGPMEEMALEDVSLHIQKVDLDTKTRKEASDLDMKYANHDDKDQTNASEDLEVSLNEEFESLDSHDHVDVLDEYMDYYNELENSLNNLDSKLKWYDDNPHQIKEGSDYEEDLVGYYEELTNILGKQFEEVEVLLKQNKLELSKKDDVEQNASDNFSVKKSKVYAVHPYQIKSKEAPSMHGRVMYLTNEDEDISSPLRYYQQYGRKSNTQYSYLPKKDSLLLKLFPGIASESNSNNQPLRTKTKFQHGTLKEGGSSKISLERMNTGWPLGYDLTQKPSEYSIMHKVNLNLHPQLALMKQKTVTQDSFEIATISIIVPQLAESQTYSCTEAGRFPAEPSCLSNYWYCKDNGNSILVAENKECPYYTASGQWVFCPNTAYPYCVPAWLCPTTPTFNTTSSLCVTSTTPISGSP